ncbi:chitooligosaccharidolytic beta-N-acetylglucosaminidase [Copidosoma floridanum]|uniref:chitooligosaccharidolytic beta-N-acetylglucosaminidase n=1 Tax=Copidosoma floridanum TaxID=29053 RepID=UPI0006C985D9|nr:chitooligosaccharidolytic beta-N-acetylglucosaminidase [Copidosoma floridanum]
MRSSVVLVVLSLLTGSYSDARNAARQQPFLRVYECKAGNRCERTDQPIESDRLIGIGQHGSLQACRLVCSKTSGLWPIPTGLMTMGTNYVPVHPRNFMFVYMNDELEEPARVFASEAVEVFLKNVKSTCGGLECSPVDRQIVVYLTVKSSTLDLDWETNESYDLRIPETSYQIKVFIESQTVYGLRHGLETLSQLIVPSIKTANSTELVMINYAWVKDKPVFPHRGLLIDTGRNFLPVDDILRTIDGLAASKMNVLHWHATDSQSFPLEIKSLPLMSLYGAYGPEFIYTVDDMQKIRKYANSRGVRVILEIDSPSHACAGWEWGPAQNKGNLVVCVNQQPWRQYCIQPPCGQLNPMNKDLYDVLRTLYKELLGTFGRNGMMHLGGDELFINCWNSSEEIVTGMSEIGLGRSNEDFLKIWSYVHNKQLEILNQEGLDKNMDKAIIWSSQLTSPELIETYLDKSKFIVQTWVEADKDLNQRLLDLGYKLIISTKDAWYLDHGFWGITKYHTWRDAYKNIIPQKPGVLGGEAAMWGEYVNQGSLHSRVWPRTAAVAERLWSDPPASKMGTADAEPRLQAHIDRLGRRAVHPDALAPEWCNQHEGQCS